MISNRGSPPVYDALLVFLKELNDVYMLGSLLTKPLVIQIMV